MESPSKHHNALGLKRVRSCACVVVEGGRKKGGVFSSLSSAISGCFSAPMGIIIIIAQRKRESGRKECCRPEHSA